MRNGTETNQPSRKIRSGSGPAIPVSSSPQQNDLKPEFPGQNLENVIAKVAVERTRSGEALQSLTGRLLEAQEEERRRLARELHDGLNQQLAMLAVELGVLARQVPDTLSALRDQLFQLRSRTEGLSNDVRAVTHQLHPVALEHLGLVAALRSYCTELGRHAGIQIWFSMENELGYLPIEVAVSLYRIVQEALRNVAKHSGSREAWVKMVRTRHQVRLAVVDKGTGFSPQQTQAGLGLGLISMRERVQLVCGSLTIKAAPKKGTTIEVCVPITWKERRYEQVRKYEKTETVAGR
jgi:signal transduction histidine kinase